MWRKNWQDRVMSHIQENSSLYIFNAVLLLMGVIFGAILVNSLQINQKTRFIILFTTFFLDKSLKENLPLQAKCFEKVTFRN